MRLSKKIAALSAASILAVTGMFSSEGTALAAPAYPAPEGTLVSVSIDLENEAQAAAELASALLEAEAPSEQRQLLIDAVGATEAEAIAAEFGVTLQELFSVAPSENGWRANEGFMACMRQEVSDDLRTLLDINAVAALIGQQRYMDAARGRSVPCPARYTAQCCWTSCEF